VALAEHVRVWVPHLPQARDSVLPGVQGGSVVHGP
jgi:hypothetical protein